MNLKLFAIATAFAVLSVTGAQASSKTLIQKSHQLESIVKDLRFEFREHYDHTSLYQHLIQDARKIEALADHIHDLAHSYYASTSHILHELEEIDELVHHIHQLVDAAETGHYGHVHGSTLHVHKELDALNGLIHSMESTVIFDAKNAHHGHHGSHGDHDDHGHGNGHGHGHDDHDHGHGSKKGPPVKEVREVIRFFLNR